MLTGCLWNACEAVEYLPQNNLQVTCKILQREESLVLDALEEIEQVFYFFLKKYFMCFSNTVMAYAVLWLFINFTYCVVMYRAIE
jgi:hypothetical protein